MILLLLLITMAWIVAGTHVIAQPMLSWFLRVGGNETGFTALLVGTLQLTAMVVSVALYYWVTGPGGPVAALAALVWALAYTPWASLFMPAPMVSLVYEPGFTPHRTEAETTGFTRGTARALFWTSLPFVFVGFSFCIGGAYTVVLT